MIATFKCKYTKDLYNNIFVPKFRNIEKVARRKLEIIDAVERLDSLRIPPSNRLEKLKGDRKNTYSIRINDQYRICFEYAHGNFYEVEIVDYH